MALSGLPVAHHLRDVLRVHAQEEVTLFHEGQLYRAVVEDASREGLSVRVLETWSSPFMAHPVTLLQAIIRPALLDEMVRLNAALGVSRIVLYPAQRSQPWHVEGRLERFQQIALAGAEQSEAGIVPSLVQAGTLEEALRSVQAGARLLVCSPAARQSILQAEQGISSAPRGHAFVIGPEGGLTQREEAFLNSHGAVPVHLNTGILRSELAGFAATLILREAQALS